MIATALGYNITTTEALTEPSSGAGIYVPIKVTDSDLQTIGLTMSSLDKTGVAFLDNAGNVCEFRREYWNTSLGEALFIVRLQAGGSALSSLSTNDVITLQLAVQSATDLSSGPETCLLAIGKGDNGKVVDVSGNSGYDASVLSWGHNATYGDYLIFNGQRIQITNTNGSSDTRTILMFFNHTSTAHEMLLGFYEYDVYIPDNIGYNSDSNFYSTGFTPATNNWYHLGAIMTGTGNMVGNKMYINGVDRSLSWVSGSGNGKAVFKDYIALGSVMINTNYALHGYESQIYYFDRELSAGEIYGFYKFGNKTSNVATATLQSGAVLITNSIGSLLVPPLPSVKAVVKLTDEDFYDLSYPTDPTTIHFVDDYGYEMPFKRFAWDADRHSGLFLVSLSQKGKPVLGVDSNANINVHIKTDATKDLSDTKGRDSCVLWLDGTRRLPQKNKTMYDYSGKKNDGTIANNFYKQPSATEVDLSGSQYIDVGAAVNTTSNATIAFYGISTENAANGSAFVLGSDAPNHNYGCGLAIWRPSAGKWRVSANTTDNTAYNYDIPGSSVETWSFVADAYDPDAQLMWGMANGIIKKVSVPKPIRMAHKSAVGAHPVYNSYAGLHYTDAFIFWYTLTPDDYMAFNNTLTATKPVSDGYLKTLIDPISVTVRLGTKEFSELGFPTDPATIHFQDNAGNEVKYKRLAWDADRASGLFIVQLQKDGVPLYDMDKADSVTITLLTDATSDMADPSTADSCNFWISGLRTDGISDQTIRDFSGKKNDATAENGLTRYFWESTMTFTGSNYISIPESLNLTTKGTLAIRATAVTTHEWPVMETGTCAGWGLILGANGSSWEVRHHNADKSATTVQIPNSDHTKMTLATLEYDPDYMTIQGMANDNETKPTYLTQGLYTLSGNPLIGTNACSSPAYPGVTMEEAFIFSHPISVYDYKALNNGYGLQPVPTTSISPLATGSWVPVIFREKDFAELGNPTDPTKIHFVDNIGTECDFLRYAWDPDRKSALFLVKPYLNGKQVTDNNKLPDIKITAKTDSPIDRAVSSGDLLIWLDPKRKTTLDYSGNKYDAVGYGTYSFTDDGAWLPDGTTGYLQFPESANLPELMAYQSTLTFVAHFIPYNNSPNYDRVYDFPVGSYHYILYFEKNSWTIIGWARQYPNYHHTSFPFSAFQDFFITENFGNGAPALIVNDEPLSLGTSSRTTGGSRTRGYIGKSNWNDANSLHAYLYQFMVFKRPLALTEYEALYNNMNIYDVETLNTNNAVVNKGVVYEQVGSQVKATQYGDTSVLWNNTIPSTLGKTKEYIIVLTSDGWLRTDRVSMETEIFPYSGDTDIINGAAYTDKYVFLFRNGSMYDVLSTEDFSVVSSDNELGFQIITNHYSVVPVRDEVIFTDPFQSSYSVGVNGVTQITETTRVLGSAADGTLLVGSDYSGNAYSIDNPYRDTKAFPVSETVDNYGYTLVGPSVLPETKDLNPITGSGQIASRPALDITLQNSTGGALAGPIWAKVTLQKTDITQFAPYNVNQILFAEDNTGYALPFHIESWDTHSNGAVIYVLLQQNYEPVNNIPNNGTYTFHMYVDPSGAYKNRGVAEAPATSQTFTQTITQSTDPGPVEWGYYITPILKVVPDVSKITATLKQFMPSNIGSFTREMTPIAEIRYSNNAPDGDIVEQTDDYIAYDPTSTWDPSSWRIFNSKFPNAKYIQVRFTLSYFYGRQP